MWLTKLFLLWLSVHPPALWHREDRILRSKAVALFRPGGVFQWNIKNNTSGSSCWALLWNLCGFQFANSLCQLSPAQQEAVTSSKPYVHLSLQCLLPGNGCNTVNPPARGSTPMSLYFKGELSLCEGAAHSQPHLAKRSWKVPKHLSKQC